MSQYETDLIQANQDFEERNAANTELKEIINQSESVNYCERANLLQEELEEIIEKYSNLLQESLDEKEKNQ